MCSFNELRELREQGAEHRLDALISTVGGNPVPTAVAARVLLEECGYLHLLHTTGSRDAADALTKLLSSDGFQVQLHPVHDSASATIFKTVQGVARGLGDGAGRVGIDYTGGTKSMSTAAHLAVLLARSNATTVYIDARAMALRLVTRNEHGARDEEPIVVEGQPILSLDELLLLQLWHKEGSVAEPVFPKTAARLAGVLANNGWRTWSKWVDRLRTRLRANGEWDRAKMAVQVTPTDAQRAVAEPILKALHEEAGRTYVDGLTPGDFAGVEVLQPLVDVEPHGYRPNHPQALCEWLDGKWLEHHVLAQLRTAGISWHGQPVNSLRARARISQVWVNFEVDLVGVVGYQLHAVSCTTSSDRGECKLKLFEIAQRAAQLGGAEAQVALVCTAEPKDVAALEQQMAQLLPDARQPFIFGRNDLAKLGEKYQRKLEAAARSRREKLAAERRGA